MKTKARIQLYTFEKGQTQGRCLHVATINTTVELVTEQVTFRNGCLAPELVMSEVLVVNIKGRRFICEKSNFDNTIDYCVGIPQDLAETIKASACPCCNATILI